MSKYTKSMTGRTAGKKQVNPTVSAKAPSPASPSGKQVNVTVSGKQPSGRGHKGTETNKTFAVANKSASVTKGKSQAKLVARKSAVGAPQAKGMSRPIFTNMLKSNDGNAKLMTPVTRNGSAWPTGSPSNSRSTDHPEGVKDRGNKVPTRNESAPVGANPGVRNKQNMTVQRLKGLGF